MSNCVFCKLIRGEIPSKTVREWDDAIAIVPLGPVTESRFPDGFGHVLIIPKQHVEDFTTDPVVTAATCKRAAEYANECGTWRHMNMITSKGSAATQTVFHLHIHLVPREAADGFPLPWTPQQEREAAAKAQRAAATPAT